MFGTRRKKNQLADYGGNRWAVELLQVYHMPIMNIRQGWHMLDVCPTEEAAKKKLQDYAQVPGKLRVRRLSNEEEEVILEDGLLDV